MLNYYIMILCNAITTVTQLPCALHKESFYTKSAAGRETNMNEENRITLILIDTCAFREANSDFPGIVKSLLPSFFSTVDEKGIALLTHPVLENEIRKHIEDSSIFKDYQSLLTQLRKCTSTLKHYRLDDVLLPSKISELDIQTKLFESYQQYYQDAIHLDFGDPASVFELYFNSQAPFAMSGKKKAEFPDAFVFDATRKYLEKHPNDILLVISKDSDWTTAFNQIEDVIICDSISNALTKISNIDSILSQEMLSQIFRGAYKEIISNAQQKVECECFELDDYENLNELEIESVKVDCVSDNFIPLKIARDSLLLSTNVTIKVSGYAEVFDEENSIWDSVDREYFYMAYADIDFTDAEVEVDCEILISFDFDDPENTAQVMEFRLLNQGNICIDCEGASIREIDEEELSVRALREDKG